MLFDWLKPENRKETFYGKKKKKNEINDIYSSKNRGMRKYGK